MLTAKTVGKKTVTVANNDETRVGARKRPSKQQRMIALWRSRGAAAVFVLMVLGGVIGLLFFARPTESAVERRTLTQFPAITLESFIDGTWFTDVSLWYSDTYPLREPLVSANKTMAGFYGVSTSRALVGGNVKADEVPVAALSASDTTAPATNASEPAAPRRMRPAEQVEAPDERVIAAAVQDSIMNGLYIKDGIAYSICYFSQYGADIYIDSVNIAAEQLDGVAHVYSLLVPSSAVALPEDEYEAVGGSDQRAVFDYIWTRFDDRVTQVDVLDSLREHSDDYVFFRTDHHWTQRGAYYGYVEFCHARGVQPRPLESYTYGNTGDFAGSYYESIYELMEPWIDEFETFTPTSTNDMINRDNDGTEEAVPIVDDTSDWGMYGKYDAFSGCDPALGIMHNPNIKDGSSCLVVKDSYGSAFAPFLVDDYEYVYVLDPRVYSGNVCAFARDNGIQDVVFVYGVKVAINEKYSSMLLETIEE